MRADRQTNRPTYRHSNRDTLHPLPGRSKNPYWAETKVIFLHTKFTLNMCQHKSQQHSLHHREGEVLRNQEFLIHFPKVPIISFFHNHMIFHVCYFIILPRDAMLALYMLSSCVCLSVTSLSSTTKAKPRIT